jgi:hypothetical protein
MRHRAHAREKWRAQTMTRLTPAQIARAVRRVRPHHVPVPGPADEAGVCGADAVSADLAVARRKYDSAPQTGSAPEAGGNDVLVVTHTGTDGPGPRSVVLDPSGSILSEQG